MNRVINATVEQDSNSAKHETAAIESCATNYTIIQHPVTVGRNVRFPAEIAIRDIAYVMDAIRTGSFEGYNLQRAITVLRAMTDKEAQKTAKQTLPWFCGSVIQRKRANANVKHAEFMVFDLDHVADIEATKALAMAKLPYLRWAFRSVTDGVKLIAQFTQPITSEAVFRQVYVFIAMQIEWAVKHITDATPDWARACFMSFDPGLLHNARCMPLDPMVAYKQAKSLNIVEQDSNSAKHAVPFSVFPAEAGTQPIKENRENNKVANNTALDPRLRGDDKTVTHDDWAQAEALVSALCQITIAYRDWIKAGMALNAAFGERGKVLWDMFLTNPNYNDTQRQMDIVWHSFRSVNKINLGSLFYVAEKYGIKGGQDAK